MPATPTSFTEPCTRLQVMPGSDASGFQLRFRSLFHEGRGYSFPCDAMGSVDMDRLSERARVNYFFARAMVGRDLHVAEVVAGDLHGSGADDVGPASSPMQGKADPPGRRFPMEHEAGADVALSRGLHRRQLASGR